VLDGNAEVLRDVAMATIVWLSVYGLLRSAHWHHLANTTEPFVVAAMWPSVKVV